MKDPKTSLTEDEIAVEAAKDAELHGTSVAEAIDNIKSISDVDLLRELAERESRNPKTQGGRKTLLAAIDAQVAAVVDAAAEAVAGESQGDGASGQSSGAPNAAPATNAAGLVRCRVKKDAGDFHMPVEGGHRATPPGTELSVTPEVFANLANHLERID